MLKTLLLLMWAFLQIGLFSIGGGYATLPLIQEQVVERYHWLTPQEFSDILTISQMTPGPLAVNTSTFVGIRIAGIPGAIVATLSCIACGMTISLLLYHFFCGKRQSLYISRTLEGLKAASTGLIASAAGTILLTTLCGASSLLTITSLQWPALLLFAGSLLLLRRFKPHPLLLMALTGACGLLIYTPRS